MKDEVLFWDNLTLTSFLDTGVSNGATYFYKVVVVNSEGDSTPQPGVQVIPMP